MNAGLPTARVFISMKITSTLTRPPLPPPDAGLVIIFITLLKKSLWEGVHATIKAWDFKAPDR